MQGNRPIVAWPPFVLSVDTFRAEDFPTMDPAVFDGSPVLAQPIPSAVNVDSAEGYHLWPIKPVMVKMWNVAMDFLLVEKKVADANTGKADQEDILAWVQATRRLADRWPFSADRAAELRVIADRVENTFAVRDHFIRSEWPRTLARQRQLQTSMSFWALAELREALVTLRPNADIPTMSAFAEMAFPYSPDNPDTPKAERDRIDAHRRVLDKAIAKDSLDRRIREFRRRLKAGAETDVMAWVLHDTLFFGDSAGRLTIKTP